MDAYLRTITNRTEREMAEAFLSTLQELTCNSKPQINMLTMLAEENIDYANVIVRILELHIFQVPPAVKLPVLYLIDSILKNVKGRYIELFSRCIVNIFCGAFKEVNAETRERMYKLRQTWNDVFNIQNARPVLLDLDKRVKILDPNWPITATDINQTPSIHLNPNFLKKEAAARVEITKNPEMIQVALLELKKRNLEFELEKTKKDLANQIMPAVTPQSVPTPAISLSLPANRKPTNFNEGFTNNQAEVTMKGFPQSNSVGAQNRAKVYPANSALINSLKNRDPRVINKPDSTNKSDFKEEIKKIKESDKINEGLDNISRVCSPSRTRSSGKGSGHRREKSVAPKNIGSTSSSHSSSLNRRKNDRHTSPDQITKRSHKSSSSSSHKNSFQERKHSSTASTRKRGTKSPPKSKDVKRSRSRSPNTYHDIDMRKLASADSNECKAEASPSKRLKLVKQTISTSDGAKKEPHKSSKNLEKPTGPAPLAVTTINPQAAILKLPKSTTKSSSLESEEPTVSPVKDGLKRPLNESIQSDQKEKKLKISKIDTLFGSEDVDLRMEIAPAVLPILHTIKSGDTLEPLNEMQQKKWSLHDLRLKADKLLGKNEVAGKSNESCAEILAQAQELRNTKCITDSDYSEFVQHLRSIYGGAGAENAAEDLLYEQRQAAREAVLRKRIPKLSKTQVVPQPDGSPRIASPGSADSNGSPRCEESVANVGNGRVASNRRSPNPSHRDSRRKKSASKWADTNEHTNIVISSRNRWDASKVRAGLPPPLVHSSIPPPPVPPMINPAMTFAGQVPWQLPVLQQQQQQQLYPLNTVPQSNAMPSLPQNIPPHIAPLTTATSVPNASNSIDNLQENMVRRVTIDGANKDIRVYDQVAVVFMDDGLPREVSFQPGMRAIQIDTEIPVQLAFNDDYKAITIGNSKHRVRFGFPSRELFIDDQWYEVYFGGPAVSIPLLNGKRHTLLVEGPPPKLNISNVRQDLVAGKIEMSIDDTKNVPVFLDGRVQTFSYMERDYELQFVDDFRNVLIDGNLYSALFGGTPIFSKLGDYAPILRFSALPEHVIPGKPSVRSMTYTLLNPKDPRDVVPSLEGTVPNGVELTANASSAEVAPSTNINIDELLQNLQSSGVADLLASLAEATPPSPPAPAISLTDPETLTIKNQFAIDALYAGSQCSNCGMRFRPEQTLKYNRHLDWHFREKQRECSRKNKERLYYYNLSDWNRYEEVEDPDDPADLEKNLELASSEEPAGSQKINEELPTPTCAAKPNENDRACDMCNEVFEQFFNQELEEWHLRSAVRLEDDRVYHPMCLEDYEKSLQKITAESEEIKAEDVLSNSVASEKRPKDDEDISKSGDKETEDDDDVILVPMDEPSVTEIVDDDDDDDGTLKEDATTTNVGKALVNVDAAEESDVEIQEPNIPFTDLDTYIEKEFSEPDPSSQSSLFNIKIKQEPLDDEIEDDDGFEEVGTLSLTVCEEISLQSSGETEVHTVTSSNSPAPRVPSPTLSPTVHNSVHNSPERSDDCELTQQNSDCLLEPSSEPASFNLVNNLVNKIRINLSSISNSLSKNTNTLTDNGSTMEVSHSSRSSSCEPNVIQTISTIPVLCGGNTLAHTSVSSGISTDVSSISVIGGSYSNMAPTQTAITTVASSISTSSCAIITNQAQKAASPEPIIPTPVPQYIKPRLRDKKLTFNKVNRGDEVSGLCSIM